MAPIGDFVQWSSVSVAQFADKGIALGTRNNHKLMKNKYLEV